MVGPIAKVWASAGAALLASLTLVVPAALADGGGRPIGIEPVPPKKTTIPGGVTTLATRGVSYRCNEAGTLRRAANSYVLGWCTEGMHIDISSTGAPAGWQAGWGEGNYGNCGWFMTATHSLTAEGAWDHDCGSATYPEVAFANYVNVTPAGDGTPVPIYANCTRYLNVKPWATGATAGTDPAGTLLTTDKFYWRYQTRNNMWVLGRMERPGTSVYYDWVFVPRTCVAPPLTNFRAATYN